MLPAAIPLNSHSIRQCARRECGEALESPGARHAAGALREASQMPESDSPLPDENQTGTIVVAHSNHLRRSDIARLLTNQGFTVVTASTGTEALEQIHSGQVSLVIAGVRMDEADGLELTRAVSTIPGAPPVIVVATSEDTIDRTYLRGAALLGAARTLEYPLSASVLLCSVRELLNRK